MITTTFRNGELVEWDRDAGVRRRFEYHDDPYRARFGSYVQYRIERGSARFWRTTHNITLLRGATGFEPYGAVSMPPFEIMVDIERLWLELQRRQRRARR